MNLDTLLDLCKSYSGLSREELGRLYRFFSGFTLPSGAVVQCGCTNGGSAVLLWHAVGARKRPLWMFDSFEGLPEPTSEDGGRASSLYIHHMAAHGGWCKGEIEKAQEIARLGGVPEARAHCIKGWFSDTMPAWADKVGPIALLHLDADWYKSTLDCLNWLYPYLVTGGLLVLDDYGYWPGCAQACIDYGIDSLLTKTPPTGAWLVKE